MQQYNDFAKNNSDYANLKDSPDQWLKNDIAYMAQELRKACDAQMQDQGTQNKEDVIQGQLWAEGLDLDGRSDCYSLQEITLANRFVDEIRWGSVASRSSNEEQIGLQAGVLLLKTKLFTEQSGVSDDPYFDINKNPVFDKAEINKVCERMLQTYEREKDYLKAIFDGITYARNRSTQKAEDGIFMG